MKELIKQLLPLPIAAPLTLQIIILAGMNQVDNLVLSVFPNLKTTYENTVILTIATISALSCLLWASAYFVLLFKNREKLKPKFGILWDEKKEPYCPSCKIPLSGYTERIENSKMHYLFWCHKHDKAVYLFDDNAVPISLSEAKKCIK